MHPGDRHLELLGRLLGAAGTAGNLTTDAHLAALAIEHGATVLTFDRDFRALRGAAVEDAGRLGPRDVIPHRPGRTVAASSPFRPGRLGAFRALRPGPEALSHEGERGVAAAASARVRVSGAQFFSADVPSVAGGVGEVR